jgi:regulator of cell morphogenesis and NO signaling
MNHEKTIGELALEVPGAITVLERLKIDYCCHGGRSIAEACTDAGIRPDDLIAQIGDSACVTDEERWPTASLIELQEHIVATHHLFTREILDTILLLSKRVADRHGERHPEVLSVRQIALALFEDLIPHMLKEEQVLFPYVELLERAEKANAPAPMPFFGTVRNPIAMMMAEHENAGGMLLRLRQVTSDYTLPPDACLNFRALYERLIDLERGLHRHIHLENNVLFRRAAELEAKTVPGGETFGAPHATCGCGCTA